MEDENIYKTESHEISENLIKTITWDNMAAAEADYMSHNCSGMQYSIPLSNEIAAILYRHVFNGIRRPKTEPKPPLSLMCEYDRAMFHPICYYVTAMFDDELKIYPENGAFSCPYLDDMVKRKAELFFELETTATKRFGAYEITVKDDNIIVSNVNGSDTTTMSRAQWDEMTNFVNNELDYRKSVIDYLKNRCRETDSGIAILKNAKIVDKIVELYSKRCRKNIGNSNVKTVSENITDAIVDYIVLYASD